MRKRNRRLFIIDVCYEREVEILGVVFIFIIYICLHILSVYPGSHTRMSYEGMEKMKKEERAMLPHPLWNVG